MSKDLKQQLDHLVHSGECIVFVGSGLSGKNYLPWDKLIEMLCDKCGVEDFPKDDEEKSQLSADELFEYADRAYDKNKAVYLKFLEDEFSKRVNFPPEYNFLAEIQFKSFITINFDPLLAEIKRRHRPKLRTHRTPLLVKEIEKGNVFYIHGYVPVGGVVVDKQLVLTKSDVDEAYDPYEGNIHSFLDQLFKSYNVLFIGCGLKERELSRLLEVCQNAREKALGSNDKTSLSHFILVKEDKSKEPSQTSDPEGFDTYMQRLNERNERYKKLGINVLGYPYDKTHPTNPYYGLEQYLEEWSDLPKAEENSPYSEDTLKL